MTYLQHTNYDKKDLLNNTIFITGSYRSGTTLIEKLLHNHKNITIASQPMPLLYIYLKREFNRTKNITSRYPLNHLFLNDVYDKEEFYQFLDEYLISDKLLEEIFDDLKNYIGLWTPEILEYQYKFEQGSFKNILKQLHLLIKLIFPKEKQIYMGSKEILCEEYIPYLLDNGTKIILSIRDPRDMITSLNFRERDNQTGQRRPILYSIRTWRKSVAYAIAYKNYPNFFAYRYEDLVNNSLDLLKNITNFLDLHEIDKDIFNNGIYDQTGKTWLGNSSFNDKKGISSNSIGKYKNILPKEVISYIESCCYPEMKYLKYEFFISKNFNENSITNFQENYYRIHDKFPTNYSSNETNIMNEIERINILKSKPIKLLNIEEWFLFEECYNLFRDAMRTDYS